MNHKNRQRWHCRACDKVAFGSQSRALETVDRAQHFRGTDKPKRVYPCPYGNGYHLTKQEAKEAG